jgi:hypothetical protein
MNSPMPHHFSICRGSRCGDYHRVVAKRDVNKIAYHLRRNSVESLILIGVRFTQAAAAKIFGAIGRHSTQLQIVVLSDCSRAYVDLDTPINVRIDKLVECALIRAPGLKKLSLDTPFLKWPALCSMLAANPRLQHLLISSDVTQPLANILQLIPMKSCPKIIELSDCAFPESVGCDIRDALANVADVCIYTNAAASMYCGDCREFHLLSQHSSDSPIEWCQIHRYNQRNGAMDWYGVHHTAMRVILALLPLRLPHWSLLHILDWIPPGDLRLENGRDPNAMRKWRLVEAVKDSYEKLRRS